jgi:hypothetical protein
MPAIHITNEEIELARQWMRAEVKASNLANGFERDAITGRRDDWAAFLARNLAPRIAKLRDDEAGGAMTFTPKPKPKPIAVEDVDADESAAIARAMRDACDEPGVGFEERRAPSVAP